MGRLSTERYDFSVYTFVSFYQMISSAFSSIDGINPLFYGDSIRFITVPQYYSSNFIERIREVLMARFVIF